MSFRNFGIFCLSTILAGAAGVYIDSSDYKVVAISANLLAEDIEPGIIGQISILNKKMASMWKKEIICRVLHL